MLFCPLKKQAQSWPFEWKKRVVVGGISVTDANATEIEIGVGMEIVKPSSNEIDDCNAPVGELIQHVCIIKCRWSWQIIN